MEMPIKIKTRMATSRINVKVNLGSRLYFMGSLEWVKRASPTPQSIKLKLDNLKGYAIYFKKRVKMIKKIRFSKKKVIVSVKQLYAY